MKVIIVLTGLVLSYLLYGFYISQAESSIIPIELKLENPPGLYDYRGVSNVQTDRSKGSYNPQEVIVDAKTSGLDFIVLTDTQQIDADQSVQGYHDELLVLDEREFTYLDARLLLISANHQALPSNNNDFSVYFTDLLSQKQNVMSDSLLVLAHPFNNGPTWTGPYPSGLDGIEVLNPKSISKKAWGRSIFSVVWSFVTYPFNPRFSFLRLFREPIEETALWDKLSSQRTTWAFSGADANARALPLADYLVKFPSYQMSFGVTSNHILLSTELTGSFEKDKNKIFSALKKGQFYISLDLLGNPKGFHSYVQEKEKLYPMGAEIKFVHGQKIYAKLPVEPKDFYEIVLLKNGEHEMISNSQELVYEVKSPGVYRIYVRVSVSLPFPDGKKWISWIYTNPFYIR